MTTDKTQESIVWELIDTYFKDNPYCLVSHQLESYNDFFENGIKQVFKEKNPLLFRKGEDANKEFSFNAELYFGGKNGDKIYFGKPMIYDEHSDRSHFMFPNEARLRNMTYGLTIHYDVDIVYKIKNEEGVFEESAISLSKIFLGRFPIMLQSNFCVLHSLNPEIRFNMGECRNDRGGYFIIDGKEKSIVSQEKFADNMLKLRDSFSDKYSHVAEIRSVSEDASKPMRNFSLRVISDGQYEGAIVAVIPNVRKPIPLFTLMRAFGIISDKDIIRTCLLDLEQNEDYIELFRPSIYHAGEVYSKQAAIEFIKTFTKNKTVPYTLNILMDYVLPHIGELNFKEKAFFLGYMTKKLLAVYTKQDNPTDRDSFKYKRVEVAGSLLYDLFKEFYNLQQKNLFLKMDKEYYFKINLYEKNFTSLIENNVYDFFKERIVETGFKKAFKGNWGSSEHTKRLGVVQDLNRLSYNSFMSQLRKLNLSMDSSAKVLGPRLLNTTQWGIIDPLDTPDGGNVGLHKHLAISSYITKSCSGFGFIKLCKNKFDLQTLENTSFDVLNKTTKVFVNGRWIGNIEEPQKTLDTLRLYKRNGVIPLYTSIQWDITYNEIFICTDGGRLTRPLIYLDSEAPSFMKNEFLYNKISSKKYSWNQLISGFLKKEKDVKINDCTIYSPEQLFNEENLKKMKSHGAVLEYIDTQECESMMVAMYQNEINKYSTHLEIHPSLALGIMGNQIVFPENNQLPRNLFSCGQSKQGVSLYHSNYQNRIDKMGVILNYGQMPLTKSRYLKYINREQHPYGENAIVAIMCYSGYNVEDAVLINKGSLDRGFFRTTYFNMYESSEESTTVPESNVDSKFMNIQENNVVKTKPGYDYAYLDKYGLIKEETQLNDKIVIIGKGVKSVDMPDTFIDASSFPKKGQLGVVDKSFMTENEEGFRLAKVRIREERIPTLGDKVCSRCGQKGTIGMIIREEDMPFTASGIKPDIIINPHALPSRMTIGQLIETLMGKACALYGGFGNCTAFENKGPQNKTFGSMLSKMGYHSSGNEILYNGMTGEQLETEVFIGPTYYMRLKHMVKDKINYRARGPRTAMTRQTVHGRAKDGGLRIGEMERDGIIAHGMSGFLQESMMVRGDDFYMAVCNTTGTIAVYNESRNIFLSPMADGPIKYEGNLEENMNIVNVSKYGRSFSIVRVPYSFKLLLQEIKTMNVQMRIITEQNVDQLTNLAYSNNYKTLNMNFEADREEEEQEENVEEKLTETEEIEETQEESEEKESREFSTPPPPNPEIFERPEGLKSPPMTEEYGWYEEKKSNSPEYGPPKPGETDEEYAARVAYQQQFMEDFKNPKPVVSPDYAPETMAPQKNNPYPNFVKGETQEATVQTGGQKENNISLNVIDLTNSKISEQIPNTTTTEPTIVEQLTKLRVDTEPLKSENASGENGSEDTNNGGVKKVITN